MGNLVLGRKLDEKVLLRSKSTGWTAEVKVVRCSADKVRLAFDFPADIEIFREELFSSNEQLATSN